MMVRQFAIALLVLAPGCGKDASRQFPPEALCGDGSGEPGALCDGGGEPESDGSCPGCPNRRCGDGVVDKEAGEECDDGNEVDGDGCDRDCAFSCHADAECDDELPCNGTESCDPAAHVCVSGDALPVGTVCRPAAGPCDAEETCDGRSADCPPDQRLSVGSACRAAAGACDVAEVCDGSSAACPPDGFAEVGVSCDDGSFCTDPDGCDGDGACVGTMRVCDDGVPCTLDRCDAVLDACVFEPVAGSCNIDGTCFVDGDPNPSNPCEACDPDVSATAWSPAPIGTLCRAAVGPCDVEEACDGVSTTCPADALEPLGTVCRAPAGACDVSEACDGVSSTCPVDGFEGTGTVCRPAVDVCDVAETCGGVSSSCPADELATADTVCRAASSLCDVSESCTGADPSCPVDAFEPVGTRCDDGLFCTEPDACDGLGTCSGTSRDCDDGESCTVDSCDEDIRGCVSEPLVDGCTITGTCYPTGDPNPSNPCEVCDPSVSETIWTTAPAGTTCRVSAGACDRVETCDGLSSTCPPDDAQPAGTICRAAAGQCDLPEECDGVSVLCPMDVHVLAGTICRDAVDRCDVAEACPGDDPHCPEDDYEAGGTVCRPSVDLCDAVENCTGTGPTCPVDGVEPSGTTCRDAAGQCDAAETCDGAAMSCPSDSPLPDGTICDADGTSATRDICLDATCAPSICGDSYVDTGGGETCDDGDTIPGDGCDSSCQFECDASVDNDFDGFSQCDDCDDANGGVYPDATETCNGLDDDCDTLIDEDFDSDLDGYASCTPDPLLRDCDDTEASICPGCPELCGADGTGNGVDDDCDGYVDETCAPCDPVDDDGDGFSECDGDCDDAEPTVGPGFTELCDGLDTDCNALTTDNCDVSEPCRWPGEADDCMDNLICACVLDRAGRCNDNYVCSSFCEGSFTGPVGSGCSSTQTCHYTLVGSTNETLCAEVESPLGTQRGGSACTDGSECRSNNCDRSCVGPGCNQDMCIDWCSHHDPDGDGSCASGSVCYIRTDGYAMCQWEFFGGSGVTGDTCSGSSCTWGSRSCVDGVCAEPCGNNGHCPNGYHCSVEGYADNIGDWGPGPAEGLPAVNTTPVCLENSGAGAHDRQGGAACGQNGDCVSQFCEATMGICIDLCTGDGSCPTGLGCEFSWIVRPTGEAAQTNVCLPAPQPDALLTAM